MLVRGLSIGAAAVALAASAAMAASLSEQMQTGRMTVLEVDQGSGRFMCVEHLKWTAVERANLDAIRQGDIVRVEKREGQPARLVVVRNAADELTSPEN
jgi:nitrous oxidase accessory protein NosD